MLKLDNRVPSRSQQLLPIVRPIMPELDAIRGLAILGVVFYHGLYWARDLSSYQPWQRIVLTLMSPGQFGVNLFFVLSGFLITGILLDSRNRSDFYARFYLRRALRILPAYYLTLFLLVLFGIASQSFLLISLALSSNMSAFFGIVMSYSVLWSLGVEEHFYLFWPMIVRRLSAQKLLYLLGMLIVLSPVSRFLYSYHSLGKETVNMGYGAYTWNNLDGLSLGAILAILVRQNQWNRKRLLTFSILTTFAAFLAAVAGYPWGILTRRSTIGEALQYTIWDFFFVGLLGLFVFIGSGPWRRWVAPPTLIFFGRISYGLYLFHLMVFLGYDWIAKKTGMLARLDASPWNQAWIKMLVAGGAATLVAYLSRRYFEEPFLRLKGKLY